MEEPTFTAIDYDSLENRVIEGLVRDNYSKIKNTFYKVFDKRSKNPNSPVGLCADIIEASLCVHVGFVLSWYALNTRCQKVVVLKGGDGYVKFNIQK